MPGIPPYEFRVFSRLRGRRSWTEGLQRFASPALRTDSVLVLDVPVFGHRLMVMTALAKGLPVRFVPEQFLITAMRFDMVNDRCRDETAFCFAANAPGMAFQEKLSSLLPLPSVTTCLCTGPVALALPFMFLTIFSSIRHQPGAARIFARRIRSSGHLHHLRHQKRTDSVQTSVLHSFLADYSISYRSL